MSDQPRVFTTKDRTFVYGLSEGGLEARTPEAAKAIATVGKALDSAWQPGLHKKATATMSTDVARGVKRLSRCLDCGVGIGHSQKRCRSCNTAYMKDLMTGWNRTKPKTDSLEQTCSDLADLLTKELV